MLLQPVSTGAEGIEQPDTLSRGVCTIAYAGLGGGTEISLLYEPNGAHRA